MSLEYSWIHSWTHWYKSELRVLICQSKSITVLLNPFDFLVFFNSENRFFYFDFGIKVIYFADVLSDFFNFEFSESVVFIDPSAFFEQSKE